MSYKPLVWAGTAVLIILSIFLLANTNHVINSATTSNTVSFTGEGKVVAKPDVAVVSLSLLTEAVSSKAAQDQNSAKSNAVTDFLKKQGVNADDYKTVGYNIYPQYRYPQYDRPQISGYQVNQIMEVKIRDLDKVSAILDGVVTAGANQVNSFNYQIDNPEKLKAQAREEAIKDAEKKAQALEDQVDIKLGKIVNFMENIGGYPTPMYYAMDKSVSSMGMGGGGGPSVPQGSSEIIVSVTVTYQIK